MQRPQTHLDLVRDLWSTVSAQSSDVLLDGSTLSLGQLIAVSRLGRRAVPAEAARPLIETSVQALMGGLAQGKTIYGVNTFFGGNANSKVADVSAMHRALMGLLYGILPPELSSAPELADAEPDSFPSTTPAAHAMPTAWVRGAMLLRINNFLRGHSSVRWELIECLQRMLEAQVTPVVPLQGSISASGDLSPLAYIAFSMAGNPDLSVVVSTGRNAKRVSARAALASIDVEPIRFSPKEVLGVTNGTALSASVAAQGLYDAHILALAAQVVTAMNLEGLLGVTDSFDPFLHLARPHPGQTEVAANMRWFTEGSKLLRQGEASPVAVYLRLVLGDDEEGEDDEGGDEGFFLKQDRYALRTSPQWLGPAIEDLVSAHETLRIEFNSTTDNPIADVERGMTLHGGNFQALSVTRAAEKVRDVCAYIGRMLFAQEAELVNPAMSNGLGCNLAPGEPSMDGGLKGVDIGSASYVSELGYLANRAGHYVQSAELHNQSINSLALISARYTVNATETLAKLMSNAIYVACQAVDLRALFVRFLSKLHATLLELCQQDKRLSRKLLAVVAVNMMRHTALDLGKRGGISAQFAARAVFSSLSGLALDVKAGDAAEKALATLEAKLLALIKDAHFSAQAEYFAASRTKWEADDQGPTFGAMPLLCRSSQTLYRFVRRDLGVRMYRGVGDLPDGSPDPEDQAPRRTLGTQLSVIYAASRDGRLQRALEEALPGQV